MSGEKLQRYLARARLAGVEASLLPVEELPAALGQIIGGSGFSRVVLSDFPDAADLGEVTKEALLGAGCTLLGRGECENADLGVTFCENFVAATGSLIVRSDIPGAMLGSLLPAVHLAISRAGGCLEDLPELLEIFKNSLPSRFGLITGPSRTGDIEATMTTCVHGPGRVLHLIVE